MIYCGLLEYNCDVYYQMDGTPCADTYTIPSTNLAAGNYFIWIIDKLGNIFYAPVTSAGGSIDITASDFPIGMFSEFFGSLKIFVSSDQNAINIEPLTIDGENYNGLTLKILEP